MQQHSFFEEYQDVCSAKAGQDKDWAIGTELRQCMLNQPDIMEPDDFRAILVDDSLRRLYVLDADVVVSLASSDTEQQKCDTFLHTVVLTCMLLILKVLFSNFCLSLSPVNKPVKNYLF